MPPVWTDLGHRRGAGQRRGPDGGSGPDPRRHPGARRPGRLPGQPPHHRASDWRLAVTASRKVIATVEKFVAGPLQDRPEWRLIPAIHLTALVHCPGGAAPTDYPGYYPQDEAHLAYYLESSREAGAFAHYLKDHVLKHEG